MRCGFIAVPRGLKGEGWRRFAEKLKDAVSMSSILGMKNNRASQRAPPHTHVLLGIKGVFCGGPDKIIVVFGGSWLLGRQAGGTWGWLEPGGAART